MADIANIIVIKDTEGIDCYPITSGEAITVQYGAGEEKESFSLDELLQSIFQRVTTDILPDTNVSVDIGSSNAKINVIFCNELRVSTVTAEDVSASNTVQAPALIAREQVQINGITISKESGGKLQPSAGIYGAVWN